MDADGLGVGAGVGAGIRGVERGEAERIAVLEAEAVLEVEVHVAAGVERLEGGLQRVGGNGEDVIVHADGAGGIGQRNGLVASGDVVREADVGVVGELRRQETIIDGSGRPVDYRHNPFAVGERDGRGVGRERDALRRGAGVRAHVGIARRAGIERGEVRQAGVALVPAHEQVHVASGVERLEGGQHGVVRNRHDEVIDAGAGGAVAHADRAAGREAVVGRRELGRQQLRGAQTVGHEGVRRTVYHREFPVARAQHGRTGVGQQADPFGQPAGVGARMREVGWIARVAVAIHDRRGFPQVKVHVARREERLEGGLHRVGGHVEAVVADAVDRRAVRDVQEVAARHAVEQPPHLDG